MRRACKAILGSLSDYLEGEASEQVCNKIEEHLKGCKMCQMHVDNMRLIITMYKRWRDVDIPRALSLRIEQVIANEIGRLSRDRKAGSRRARRRKK